MKRVLVKTEDGSHSLFVEELDENYHSIYGAIQESKHVFIEAGLLYFTNQSNVCILEIGFGTGLNALMTLIENDKLNKKIHYTGIEAFPVNKKEANSLNYIEELEVENHRKEFEVFHSSEWEISQSINSNFNLTKHKIKFENYQPQSKSFDIIYFDAFAPSAQGHLWSEAIFKKLFDSLKSGGILVTYCAKGSVKRTLKSVGFTLEALPGPKGKREMTRAVKIL